MHNNLLGEGYWCVHNPCVIFSRVIDVWILGSGLLLGKQKTLALWKFKIDHTGADVDREACRVEVPGPVKDLSFNTLNVTVHWNSLYPT